MGVGGLVSVGRQSARAAAKPGRNPSHSASAPRAGETAAGRSPNQRAGVRPIGQGVEVYVVSADLTERGLQSEELIGGLKTIRKADLPALCGSYDQVRHW